MGGELDREKSGAEVRPGVGDALLVKICGVFEKFIVGRDKSALSYLS
jgi:hypothetical protein